MHIAVFLGIVFYAMLRGLMKNNDKHFNYSNIFTEGFNCLCVALTALCGEIVNFAFLDFRFLDMKE